MNAPDISAPATLKRSGRIRPFARGDVAAVADMFQGVFRASDAPGGARLQSDLAHFFLDHPHFSPATAALIYERPDGAIGGFAGFAPLKLRFDEAPLLGSIISTWMVADRARDREAGGLLVRAHLKRGHALTATDTANDVSVAFLQQLRFDFSHAHALRWVLPLNFSAYSAGALASRLGLGEARRMREGAFVVERLMRRLSRRPGIAMPPGWSRSAVSAETFAQDFCALSQGYRLRPDWTPQDVAWMIAFAARRNGGGRLRLGQARDASGAFAGCYAYFADRRGQAETIQILARPQREEGVLRALIEDATAAGCSFIVGHADPALLRGLRAIPNIFFRQSRATAMRSRTPEHFAAVATGKGLIGGLIGDSWTPMAVDPYA
ncbi:MAG: hypothetical protein KGL46_02250 [Hyphomicrobiales bacterium]|nr:hypothetical protein [Hyphomicrobiales bacterium]